MLGNFSSSTQATPGQGGGLELRVENYFFTVWKRWWKGAQIQEVGGLWPEKHCQSQVRGALGLRGVA